MHTVVWWGCLCVGASIMARASRIRMKALKHEFYSLQIRANIFTTLQHSVRHVACIRWDTDMNSFQPAQYALERGCLAASIQFRGAKTHRSDKQTQNRLRWWNNFARVLALAFNSWSASASPQPHNGRPKVIFGPFYTSEKANYSSGWLSFRGKCTEPWVFSAYAFHRSFEFSKNAPNGCGAGRSHIDPNAHRIDWFDGTNVASVPLANLSDYAIKCGECRHSTLMIWFREHQWSSLRFRHEIIPRRRLTASVLMLFWADLSDAMQKWIWRCADYRELRAQPSNAFCDDSCHLD